MEEAERFDIEETQGNSQFNVWLNEQIEICNEINQINGTVQEFMTDRSGFLSANEVFNDAYFREIDDLISKIDEVSNTNTELDSYDECLKEAILQLKDLSKNIVSLVNEANAKYDDIDLLTNYVLLRLENGINVDELYAEYVKNTNEFFKRNGETSEIVIDSKIVESIEQAKKQNANAVMTVFMEDFGLGLDYNAQYLDHALNDEVSDQLLAWDEALQTVNNISKPMCDEIQARYAGTMMETYCTKYTSFVSDYEKALDYALNSTNELMGIVSNQQSGILKRGFTNWAQPFLDRKQWSYYKETSNGYYEVSASDNEKYWTWLLAGDEHDPSVIFSTYTADEAYNLFVSNIVSWIKEKGDEDVRTYMEAVWKFSKEEYDEIFSLINGDYSTGENYEEKTSENRENLQKLVLSYQEDYNACLSELSETAQEYDIDLSAIILELNQ